MSDIPQNMLHPWSHAFAWLRNVLPGLSGSSVYKVMATLNRTDLHQQDTSCLGEYKKESGDRLGPGAS